MGMLHRKCPRQSSIGASRMTEEYKHPMLLHLNDHKPPIDPEKGIERGADGDPLPQGTRMIERDSYDRVIEGLRIASDAAMHLVKAEMANATQWRGLATKLDQCRKICVQHAGLGLVMKEKETVDVRGDPMNWRWARDRFRYGIKQASGGCLQLAVCFRSDLWWSKMSAQLESLEQKLRPRPISQVRPKLIMPETLH